VLIEDLKVPITGRIAKSHDGIGDTALSTAAMEGNLDCVKLLVEAGADINEVAMDEGTPLSRAKEALNERINGDEEEVSFVFISLFVC
jgi:hypothetical protein